MAVPDVMGELTAIQARGGKVIVIDPVRTGTAEKADEWLPITPGTDAALLLAIAQVVFAEGRVDLGPAGDLMDGVDELAPLVADWTPERVDGVTGIPAERIRALAHELLDTERAVVYGRIGLCNQEFGTLASWLVDVVNMLTGHFDVEGGRDVPAAGGLGGHRPADARARGRRAQLRSLEDPGARRARGARPRAGVVPGRGDRHARATGQIRALFTVAGNPVLSTPGGDRLDEALAGLDCMISVDNWLNETTRHADVILPGLSALEQAHHDDLIWMFAVGSGAKWSEPVFPPTDGRPEEWEILIRLAGACLGMPAGEVDVAAIDDGFFDAMAEARGVDGAATVPGRATTRRAGPSG